MRKNALNIVNNSHSHNYLLKKSNFISNNNGGYNLVILSMIILIMGAIMTAVIGYYDTSNINRKTKITEDKFKVIHTALVNYIMRYGKLPCPAPLDCDQNGCNGTETHPEKTLGVEFRRNSQIENECLDDGMGVFKSKNEYGEELLYGNVPAFTLGLDTDFLADEWGNKIVYIISNSSTQEDALTEIIKSSNNNESNEYVKDGQLFILLSNNTDIAGAYPLNSRESNHFESTKIVRYTDENGEVIEVEQKVPNLPESNFTVSADDSNPLNYHKNILNMHPAFASVEPDVNNLTNYKCPPLNNFTYEIQIDEDGEEDEGRGSDACRYRSGRGIHRHLHRHQQGRAHRRTRDVSRLRSREGDPFRLRERS